MAVSVLPTPLVPASRNTPIGVRGSVRFARDVRIDSGDAIQRVRLADDLPLHQRLQVQTRCSTWSAIIRPTGMPVQAATVSLTACELTSGVNERRLTLHRLAALLRGDLSSARSDALSSGVRA